MFKDTIYGPAKPSLFALRGIRFIEGEDGAAPAEPAKPEAPQPEPAQDTDWKAEARKWEARAKENTSAAQRLAEIEEANKTEAEKTAERLAAAEKRAADLEAKATRAEVAAAKGVPAALLTGSTQEELEAAADALIAFRGEQKPPTPKSSALNRVNQSESAPVVTSPGIGTLRAAYGN